MNPAVYPSPPNLQPDTPPAANSKIDWPGLMRAGFLGLGLRGADFWAMTPGELRLRLGLDQAQPPLTRARLAELAAAYPDKTPGP